MRRRPRRLVAQRSLKAGLPPGTPVHIGEKTEEKARISLIEYDEQGVREDQIDGVDGLRPGKDSAAVRWINVDGVHDVELLRRLAQTFGLHPLVLEDIANTDQRPKLEDYGEYLYLVLKMLSYSGGSVMSEQVSLVLGSRIVLSFQEQGKPGDVFDPIRKQIRTHASRIRARGADFLIYSLIDAIVDQYFVILERMGERIEQLEDEILRHPSPGTLNAVHELRREMIFLRRSVWPLREILNAMQRGGSRLVQEATAVYLRDVYDHTVGVIDTIENFRDMVQGMLDVYLSSISYRMNEVMKVLTVIATLFIPLTFIVGVYGMNFDYFPELRWHWAYPVLWVIMIGIALLMLAYFKRKRWI